LPLLLVINLDESYLFSELLKESFLKLLLLEILELIFQF
jgi:hypothetical protein